MKICENCIKLLNLNKYKIFIQYKYKDETVSLKIDQVVKSEVVDVNPPMARQLRSLPLDFHYKMSMIKS